MISNYYFSSAGGYFSPPAEINPLLHTWSLGVEEQYYLLAPAFMGLTVWLAARRNWDATRALLIGGLIAIWSPTSHWRSSAATMAASRFSRS